MSRTVPQISPGAPLQKAADTMRELGTSSLAVIEGERLAGIISHTDLLRVGRRTATDAGSTALLRLPTGTVAEAMSRTVVCVSPTDALAVVARHMVAREFHRIIVTSDERVVGVITSRDVMRALVEHRVDNTIADVMSSPTFTIDTSETLATATRRLERAGISGLVVVEDDWPVGLFTQVEALQSRLLSATTRVEEAMNAAFVCMPTSTSIHRAAAQALALRVRRIVAVERREMKGILTGIDFARIAAGMV